MSGAESNVLTLSERPGSSRAPLHVLHVESNPDDQVLFQLACRKAAIPAQFTVADTAGEAIALLSRSNRLPDLVLLDLILPGPHGTEVLKFVRSTPSLSHVPVVIYTGSEDNRYRSEALRLGASDFFIKPQRFKDTVSLARELYQAYAKAGCE